MSTNTAHIRQHAEQEFAHEIEAIIKQDTREKPGNWKMSPWGVLLYIQGGKLDDGTEISPKYIGHKRLIEIAIATLATDRALLLIGVPGTGKTWLAEHLAAAICGDSTMLVQGTAGMPEESIRYGWNYARLLKDGPSAEALVTSPIMKAMEEGTIGRIEELTRVPSDVQDTLITILSEKTIPIPELRSEVQAQKGFNVIATANDRDKGVNELSSALKRRFNTVVLPLPNTMNEEIKIVSSRVSSLGKSLNIPVSEAPEKEIERLITMFRELREGKTLDGKNKVKSPSATLSTAEAISVLNSGQTLAAYFGDGNLSAKDLAAGIVGAIVKDPVQDKMIFQEYLETVVKEREDWKDLYRTCSELL